MARGVLKRHSFRFIAEGFFNPDAHLRDRSARATTALAGDGRTSSTTAVREHGARLGLRPALR